MVADSALTLGDIGEFGLLQRILPSLSQNDAVLLGPGDDGAVVDLGRAALSTDTMVQDVDFRVDWSTAHEVGQRVAAANLADLEAMGADPVALLVTLLAPADTSVQWATQCLQGIAAEAARVGASVVGGDLGSSPMLVISVTATGRIADDTSAISRAGAQVGDWVAIAGQTGLSAAGLVVLQRGFRSPRRVVQAFRVPPVPYGQGLVAAQAGAHAMIDTSDGLVADLGHIARRSGVEINIDSTALIIDDELAAVGQAFNVDPMQFALFGGEDHALAATFSPGQLPPGFARIGRVTALNPDGQITIDSIPVADGPWSQQRSFEHFSS